MEAGRDGEGRRAIGRMCASRSVRWDQAVIWLGRVGGRGVVVGPWR